MGIAGLVVCAPLDSRIIRSKSASSRRPPRDGPPRAGRLCQIQESAAPADD
jgi:hypothetical protein